MAFDAGAVEASLRLDRTPFNEELRGGRADADKFVREGITVPLDADPAKAKAKIAELKRDKVTVKGDVDLDTARAKAKIAELKKFADQTIGVKFAAKLGEAPAWLGPAILALPAAMTILGTATGAAVALGSALATGGIALGVYASVAKSVIGQASAAASKVQLAQERYNAAVAAGAPKAAAYLTEQKAINLAYASMSPAQIRLSRQLGAMSDQWTGVKKSLTPVVALSVAPWMAGITSAMAFAKPVVSGVSQEVSSLGSTFAALVNLPAFGTFARFIGTEGSAVVGAGGGALLNFFHGFILLLPQFRPLIDDVDQGITHLGTSFLTWAQSAAPRTDMAKFMAFMHDNGPTVASLLSNIGRVLRMFGTGFLGGAGTIEIRVISDFFRLISDLPPSFVQPVADLAASLLIISKFSFGRKLISIGVNWVGGAAAQLLKFLTGGKIDLAGKFSADAAMQAAADTMVTAAGAMQKAADTMIGADVHGGGPVVTGGKGVAAEGDTAAEGVTVGSAESAGIVGALLAGARGILIANPGLWGLAVSGDSGPRTGPSPTSPAGLGIKPGQTAVKFLTSGPAPLSLADAEKVIALSAKGDKAAISAMGLDPAVIAQIIRYTAASGALAKVTLGLNAVFKAGHIPQAQFASDLTTSKVNALAAKTMTDKYTLAIQNNGQDSGIAHTLRAEMIEDFVHQGLSAKQADHLVDTYTAGVARNGDTAAAKAQVRAQLIRDFENAGDSAKVAAGKVDTLIGQIGGLHSKSVSLTVSASGSFKITEGTIVAPGGTRIRGGVATGGLISGPGTGTSDTAGLYALSNKEFVHNAAAVDYYGLSFMNAVNKRMLPKMAAGGLAGTFAGSPAGLGMFDSREWAATQALVENADAVAAISAMRKAIAAAKAQMMGGLGTAVGGGGAIFRYAERFLGFPYVWGATGPDAFDCSGLTETVYRHFGIGGIPRTSQQQQLWAQPSGDQPGALTFFYGTGGTATHVGLSNGRGLMVNASSPAVGTVLSGTGGNSGFGVPPGPGSGGGRPPGLSPIVRNFDSGGWLPPGITMVDNRTGGPEHLTRDSGSRNQGATLSDVAGLISRLIGAVYESAQMNAGMTADGVADAIGAAATRSVHRAMYSPR